MSEHAKYSPRRFHPQAEAALADPVLRQNFRGAMDYLRRGQSWRPAIPDHRLDHRSMPSLAMVSVNPKLSIRTPIDPTRLALLA